VRARRLFRILVLAALAPLLVGGAFAHVDGFEVLSKGTFLFPPDHPAHAPFVPEKQHPCAACAVANLMPPAAAPVFLAPPEMRFAARIDVERAAPSPVLPELPGRSPPASA
jgi:hypothetical protein